MVVLSLKGHCIFQRGNDEGWKMCGIVGRMSGKNKGY